MTSCCLFHTHGGPADFDCDNYGKAFTGPDGDVEPLPAIHAGDLYEWDAYQQAELEQAAGAFEVREEASYG